MEKDYYVVSQCLSPSGLRIETIRCITSLFTARDQLRASYSMGLILICLAAGTAQLLVLFLSLRSAAKLSRTTRRFAAGDLSARASCRNKDEIGALAEDFNQMAETIAAQMEQLKDAAQRQEQFTAAFAHELKTPLTSMIGYSDMLRSMDLSPREQRVCGEYIYNQSRRLQSLSYKLLELILSEHQKLQYASIDCVALGRELSRIEQTHLKEKQLRLVLQIAPGKIRGDRDFLLSLFLNLIDNGIKASQPGGHIFLIGRSVADGYAFLVKDEGCGVDEALLPRLTDAFFMVDKSRSRKEGGAGLGLSLCAKIVALHNAKWRFESSPGQGLTAGVYFGKEARHEA